MKYSVYFELFDRNEKLLKKEHRVCFSALNHYQGTKLIYYINNKCTKEVTKQYLDTLCLIPEFKTLINPRRYLIYKDTLIINLTKINNLKLFTLLTLIRILQEQPNIVDLIIKLKLENDTPFIQTLLKNTYNKVENKAHWLCFYPKKVDFNHPAWINKTPASNNILLQGLYNMFGNLKNE